MLIDLFIKIEQVFVRSRFIPSHIGLQVLEPHIDQSLHIFEHSRCKVLVQRAFHSFEFLQVNFVLLDLTDRLIKYLQSVFVPFQEHVGALYAVLLLNLHLDVYYSSELVEEPESVVLAKNIHRSSHALHSALGVLAVDIKGLQDTLFDNVLFESLMLVHYKPDRISQEGSFFFDNFFNSWYLSFTYRENFVNLIMHILNLVL